MSSFLLLGTGACEGVPAPFCTCDLCRYARAHGGKDVRKRFSVLVNEDTLIDFGPDAARAFREHAVDETAIRRILVTHSHCDHFQPMELVWRGSYSEKPPLTLYSGPEVRAKLAEGIAHELHCGSSTGIVEVDLVPGKSVVDDKWTILPIRATHGDRGECAFNYLLTAPDGHKLLILSDTGWWCAPSWESVENAQADAAVIEMSYGIHDPYADERRTHLGARAALDFIAELKRRNALREGAVVVTAHISHCSNTRHEELERWFAKTPLRPGYDGLRVEF
ncbi:MAG: MBL fold metallo-hydrolase [Victivallaceae bacterium]|nr:MBL fold metallo-hydrolase [Victivallaceae bacterium]